MTKLIYAGTLYNSKFKAIELKCDGSSYELLNVKTHAEFRTALEKRVPTLILADFGGFFNEALQQTTAFNLNIPVIVLGTGNSEEDAIAAFRLGATDYISVKHIDTLSEIVQKYVGPTNHQLHIKKQKNSKSLFRDIVSNSADGVLHDNEKLLAETLDALPSSITLIDGNGVILTTNKAWRDFAIANGDVSLEQTSVGCNYIDICRASMETGDEFAKMAYVGINDVLSGSTDSFQMEYPCNSPEEKRWFFMQAKRLDGDATKTVISHLNITDRKLAEDQLKSSEMKFRIILEQNLDGIALLDMTGKSIYASPSTSKILGYSEQEIFDIEILSLAHPEDIPILEKVFMEALANPGIPTAPQVTRMRTKQGDWKYIEGTLTNMLHEPLINAFIDNFRDVTERKLAHDKLVKTNRFFSILSRINQIVAHATSEAALFQDVCEAVVEVGGFDMAWIGLVDPISRKLMTVASDGMPITDVLNDLSSYPSDGQLNNLISGSQPYALFSRDNGSGVQAISEGSGISVSLKQQHQTIGAFSLYSNDPHVFDNEEILLLMDIANEITFAINVLEQDRARKDVKQKLKIKNAELTHAQAMAKLGTWQLNLENDLASWSVELLAMYGLPLDQKHITYEKWLSMIHPEDRDNLVLLKEEAKIAKTGFSISHRIIRTDGNIRHIVSQLESEHDHDGNTTLIIGVAQDITDMHDIRQALQASEKAFMQSESRYRQIVELANEGICLLNEQNQIVFTNARLSEMLGYSATEFFNENLLSFLYSKSKHIQIALNRKLKKGASDVIDICLKSKSEEAVWTRVALRPVADDFGEYKGSIALISNITETRNAEIKNQFKAHLLNNIGQAVVALSKNGIVTYWNNAAEELFGKKETDVVGMKFSDVVHPTRVAMAGEMREFTKKGKVWSEVIELWDESRHRRTCQIIAQPVYDDQKKYDGMMSITTDITEQRRLEKLTESSARRAKLGHFEVDILNDNFYCSELAKEIHGVPIGEEVNINELIRTYKEGKSRHMMNVAYSEALALCRNWDFEAELDSKDGSDIWVHSTGEVESVNGKAVRIFGRVQDITPQKTAEQSLLNAYKERDVILESIGDAFFAVDQNWIVRYWNRNAEQMLSIKRDVILGLNLWDVFAELRNGELYNRYHVAMQTQTNTEFEIFYYPLQQWLQVLVFPYPLGLSIYFKDITEKKLDELQRVELNESLTAYSNNLAAVNIELKQFSYIVSHNLRSPVSNIIGLAEELADSNYDGETREMLINSLKTSAKSLDNVITDLNDVLQLKAGGVEKRETVELTGIVNAVLLTIQSQIEKEDAKIHINLSAANEMVAVKSYLYSIMYNLIFNAVKYKKAKVQPVIEIKSARTPGGLELIVSDNGVGIDLQRTKNDIFGMYKRFHPQVEGKGIGLFMVKAQVELLGGSISVESKVGHGTTFKMFFPA